MSDIAGAPKQSGLCADCAHVRWVRSERGSSFVMCRRSADDERYARYPRLPVRTCSGYERTTDSKPERE
ncbi:MAG: hypothetical protein HYR72_22505 [Deltaproteobacteria bacterium]|nr:hypothetical protein [Deltaproteobacteria bacterium]MBI3390621.1 hypothetical protein [Deltaproteobacteria bacterium]